MIKQLRTPLNLALIVVLAFSAFTFSSCKKEEEKHTLSMSGTIVDPNTGATLGGVTVRLSSNELQDGVWSNTYNAIDQMTTSSDGRFEFSFENRTAVDYLLDIDKDGYFDSEENVNPDNLNTETTYDETYYINSKAWFKVRIVNSNPFDAADYVIYQQTKGVGDCAFCCNNGQHTLFGMAVDTTMTCDLFGDQWVKYDYFVFKDSQQYAYSDSIYVTPSDTTFATIAY